MATTTTTSVEQEVRTLLLSCVDPPVSRVVFGRLGMGGGRGGGAIFPTKKGTGFQKAPLLFSPFPFFFFFFFFFWLPVWDGDVWHDTFTCFSFSILTRGGTHHAFSLEIVPTATGSITRSLGFWCGKSNDHEDFFGFPLHK